MNGTTAPSDKQALHTVKGEEFREQKAAGLTGPEIKALNSLNDWKGAASVLWTFATVAGAAALAIIFWHWYVIVPVAIFMASRHHAFAILAHEATHYRLFGTRFLNETVGRLCGYVIGVSMCTYRVVHRLHHNHLYSKADPDIPLMAGYPRGKAYLAKKLAKDLVGLTAHRNYGYFFGAPGVNKETGKPVVPLKDTSARLRRDALVDRWMMVAFQVAMLAAAVATGWWLEYLLLWILPGLTLFQVILRFRAVLEHGAPAGYDSPKQAARTNLCPWYLSWLLFPHHVNYHVEHHLYPAIPHYNLPKAHRMLMDRGALDGAEVRSVFSTIGRVFADRQTPKSQVAPA